MKENVIQIEHKGQKYDIVFDMNVIETLQVKYGSFNNLSSVNNSSIIRICNIFSKKK